LTRDKLKIGRSTGSIYFISQYSQIANKMKEVIDGWKLHYFVRITSLKWPEMIRTFVMLHHSAHIYSFGHDEDVIKMIKNCILVFAAHFFLLSILIVGLSVHPHTIIYHHQCNLRLSFITRHGNLLELEYFSLTWFVISCLIWA